MGLAGLHAVAGQMPKGSVMVDFAPGRFADFTGTTNSENQELNMRATPSTMHRQTVSGQLSNALLWPFAVMRGAMDIGHTEQSGPYVSELWALNVHDTEVGGDWHGSAWFRREKTWRDEVPLYRGRTLPILQGTDVYDMRRALRAHHHPQGWRLKPVWGARYARACIDLAGRYIEARGEAAREHDFQEIDPSAQDLMGWLMSAERVRRALELGERMAEGDTEFSDVWSGWVRQRRTQIRTGYAVTV